MVNRIRFIETGNDDGHEWGGSVISGSVGAKLALHAAFKCPGRVGHPLW